MSGAGSLSDIEARAAGEVETARSLTADTGNAIRQEVTAPGAPEGVPDLLDEYVDAGGSLAVEPGAPAADTADPGARRPHRTHTLLISESMPDSERRQLLQQAARQSAERPDERVSVYVQGPADGMGLDDALMHLMSWLDDADLETDELELGINSQPFDEHGVDVVPTWVSVVDDEVIARAEGLGDLDAVLERAESLADMGEGRDVGRVGRVWDIEEPHFVDEFVRQRLARWMEEQGGEEAIFEQARGSYWQRHALDGVATRPAREPDSLLVDLRATVAEDIREPLKGRLIARAGQVLDPLEMAPWVRPVLVLDATRPEEVRWARDWVDEHADQAPMVLLSHMDTDGNGWKRLATLQERIGTRLYLLNTTLQERFGIRRTPSTITASERDGHVRLSEHVVENAPLQMGLLEAHEATLSALDTARSTLGDWALGVPAYANDPDPSDATCPDSGFLGRMFTDICWDCLMPFSVGGMEQPHDPDDFSAQSACLCEDMTNAGIAMGGWFPSRAVELVREPYCSPMLGGTSIDMSGAGNFTADTDAYGVGRENDGNTNDDKVFYHYHYWAVPAAEMMELMMGCQPGPSSLDMMYVSELEPSWNDDQIALATHVEGMLFANVLAQASCAGEVAAMEGSSDPRPVDEMWWCAGSWGSVYPVTGDITYGNSPVRHVALLGARVLSALARRGLLRDTVGDPCATPYMPRLIKSNFQWQHIFPRPDANNTHYTGREPLFDWGEHRTEAINGEDYIRLLWRFNECCLELGEN